MTREQQIEGAFSAGVPVVVSLVVMLVGWRVWRGLSAAGVGKGWRGFGGWAAPLGVGLGLVLVFINAAYGGFGAFWGLGAGFGQAVEGSDAGWLDGGRRYEVRDRVLWVLAGATVLGVLIGLVGERSWSRVPGWLLLVLRVGAGVLAALPLAWRRVGQDWVGWDAEVAWWAAGLVGVVGGLVWTGLSEVSRRMGARAGVGVGLAVAGLAAPVFTLAGGGALQSAGYASGAIAGGLGVVLVLSWVLVRHAGEDGVGGGREIGTGWCAVAGLGLTALWFWNVEYGQLPWWMAAGLAGSLVAVGGIGLVGGCSTAARRRVRAVGAVLAAAMVCGAVVVVVVSRTDLSGYGIGEPPAAGGDGGSEWGAW